MRQFKILLLSLLAALGLQEASAQAYPVKPIKIIVGNTPAGLADIAVRMLATTLTEALGQTIIVENRAGAGGTIATAIAARAAPDGYTLFAPFDAHASNLHLFKKIEYDTLADFAPVSLVVKSPMLLVIGPKIEVNSLAEFVQRAKSKPGAINVANAGAASPSRLMMELLKPIAGIDITLVAYKGAGPGLADLVSGQVDAMLAAFPAIAGHLRAGRLRAIGITSGQRSAFAPAVPAIAETYPGFNVEMWVGILAPARTPAEIVRHLNAEIGKALAQPDLRERYMEQGMLPSPSTPAQFDQWIRAEIERWGTVIREQNISLQ